MPGGNKKGHTYLKFTDLQKFTRCLYKYKYISTYLFVVKKIYPSG